MGNGSNIRFHGGVRGAELSRSSLLFGGPFGRMFRALPPADFGPTDQDSLTALDMLAGLMLADAEDPKNGPDPEESGIPAAYTYFGQFIDHDLTFDPASSLQKQNDPDALVDYRTPRFDLDNVYGRGPDDQPYLYEDGARFVLGGTLHAAGTNMHPRDLPRSHPLTAGTQRRAIIGDPRNDENTIVSQLQGLFLRFHNKMVDLVPDKSFEAAQRAVRFHYQWIVLNDFLPTLIDADVLNEVLPHIAAGTDIVRDPPRLRFYHARDEAFMPLEFSAAAYRFGHSMVRPEYQLNLNLPGPFAIFAGNVTSANLRGFREIAKGHAIDWRLFIDLEQMDWGDENDATDPHNKSRTQRAYKIDTSLVNPLGHLPDDIAVNPNALAQRNLERGWRMRLPSGQTVARAMGLTPLTDDKIRIGKFTGDAGDIVKSMDDPSLAAFHDNCPLWTYVLAETVEKEISFPTNQGTKTQTARLLGEVGGRIVAETMVGILLADSSSFLAQDPLWTPNAALLDNGRFGLRELIKVALS